MKTIAFSGAHGSGKTQVCKMVTDFLLKEGYAIESVGSTSNRAWERFFATLYPGRDYSEWQSLRPEDQDLYQIFAMGLGISDLAAYNLSEVGYRIMDRSIYDVYSYCEFKPDVSDRVRLLARELLIKSLPLIDLTLLFSPEKKYALDEKSTRATYDRFSIDASFHKIADLYIENDKFISVPDGTLEEKAEFILKEVLDVQE